MLVVDNRARVYVHRGMVVADCPYPACYNAQKLDPGQTAMACIECQLIAPLEWPHEIDEIVEALEARPVPATRNWAPAGHRQAVACGLPDGQSVLDLIDENRDHGIGGQ